MTEGGAPNPNAAEIVLNLDKPRTFKLSLGAIRRFHKATGINILELDTAGLDRLLEEQLLDPGVLEAFLWAGLAHGEGRDLTPEDVGDLMDLSRMPEITAALGKVFSEAAPRPAQDGEAGPPGTSRSTGTN